LAVQLAGDRTELQLRCAALNLRKTHKLQPIPAGTLNLGLVSAGPFRRINLASLLATPGGYAIYDQNRPVFAGETENLQKRVGNHLRYGLPEWLGIEKDDELSLKFVALPARRDDRLDWLGGFINRERPLFNYQKAA
jgi:hypothetical protein